MTRWTARRLALDALMRRRGRLLASVVGVVVAGTLAIAQIGLYAGFLRTCTSVARHIPGELWVMAEGTEVMDYGEPLPAGVRQTTAAHPCVEQVSGVIVDFMPVRSGDDKLRTVQLIGVDDGERGLVPWRYARGDDRSVAGGGRIAVGDGDADKLGVSRDGDALQFAGGTGYVAATTQGIHSIALTPYVFTSLPDARRFAELPSGSATFWVAHLSDASCGAQAAREIAAAADVEVLTRERFIARTESYWIEETGIGAMLLFGTLLALFIGMVVVGQTLHGLVAGHRRELAMLKALGAPARSVAGFVAWQAVIIAATGSALAVFAAVGLRAALARVGLALSLDPPVMLAGLGGIALMSLGAMGMSYRAIVKLDPAEAFRG